jgi:DMSO/TMAO reductase YedYZ molybdopterin-dependent catalytic subunit
VFGAVDRTLSLTYAQISELATQEWEARLDCTIGWYTDQVWRGPSLSDVLARAGVLPEAASVRLIAQGGNSMAFPIGEVRRILLATHVGSDSLSHEHGFPMRVVAPSYRGWHWIKWLHRINVISIREI